MAFERDEALLLEVIDLQDSDRIVAFLSRQHGQKRGVAKGARRPHSRFAGQLQPLAKARIDWREKEGRDLVRISDVDVLRPVDLSGDLEGLLVGSYLADHLLEFVQENEPGDLWFRLLDSTVEALLDGVDRDLAARYFETWVLRLSGIFPEPRECPQCGRGLASEGVVLPPDGDSFVCRRCSDRGLRIAPEVLEFVIRSGRRALGALAKEPPSRDTLRLVEQICAQIRRQFLQRELRSYEVIQQTLGAGRAFGRFDGAR
ncbi:MAG: DNA repair protein RecO [Acidobacteriota bacterium]